MHLYHGSPVRVDRLIPPSLTGNFRPGEEGRSEFSDVIFLTSDRQMALNYAGPNGYLYVVDVEQPSQYKAMVAGCAAKMKRISRKKFDSLREDVFVAPADELKYKARFSVKKGGRNKPTYVVLDY